MFEDEEAEGEGEGTRPLLSDAEALDQNPQEMRSLYLNFLMMCVVFSANHGCVVSCLAYATTELGDSLGGYGSGTLYVFYALTALLLSKPLVEMVGPKYGLLCGVGGYCVYIGGFLFAVVVPDLAWPVFLMAAAVGGMAGGVLWTAQ
ncbi:hypothetical protein B484DRAFT_389866, partial [Ochromonadaceae sp. CCMP2298]